MIAVNFPIPFLFHCRTPAIYCSALQNRCLYNAHHFFDATLSVSCSLWGGLVFVKDFHTALGMLRLVVGLLFLGYTGATPLLWDGRAPFNLTNGDLNASIGTFLM